MGRYERDLLRAFPGTTLKRTNGGHIKLCLPNGRFVIVSSTTRDRRVILNTRQIVKRELTKRQRTSK